MNPYQGVIEKVSRAHADYLEYADKELDLSDSLRNALIKVQELTQTQQLLGTVSDDNTQAAFEFVTGTINRVLAEIFPSDQRRVSLEKKMYNGKYPHINVIIEDGAGHKRDLVLQSGSGLRQVVSFLFLVCLVALLKGRRIVVMDELLNGVHPKAKAEIIKVMQIFTGSGKDGEEGFQFVMVEYGSGDVGKVYEVVKEGKEATIKAV